MSHEMVLADDGKSARARLEDAGLDDVGDGTLAEWMGSDVIRARVAMDDRETLSALERLLREGRLNAAGEAVAFGRASSMLSDRLNDALDRHFNEADAGRRSEIGKEIDALTARIRGMSEGLGLADELFWNTGEQVPIQTAIFAARLKGMGLGAIIGGGLGALFGTPAGGAAGASALGAISARTGSMVGAGIFSALAAYRLERNASYSDFLRDGISDPAARIASCIYAGIASVIEFGDAFVDFKLMGLDRLFGTGASAATKFTAKQMVRNAMGAFVKSKIVESGEEILQQAAQDAIGNAAKEIEGLPGVTAKEDMVANALTAGWKALWSLWGGETAVMRFASDVVHNNVARRLDRIASEAREEEQLLLDAIGDASVRSRLSERAPDLFQELVRAMADGGSVENVYIPASGLVQALGGLDAFMTTASPEQAQRIDDVLSALGTTREQVVSMLDGGAEESDGQVAVESAGDIVVPIDVYARAVAENSELAALLRDDRRLTPDSATRREMRDLVERARAEVRNAVEAQDDSALSEREKENREVHWALKSMLEAAGQRTELADANATAFTAMLSTMGQRAGISTKALWDAVAPAVRAGEDGRIYMPGQALWPSQDGEGVPTTDGSNATEGEGVGNVAAQDPDAADSTMELLSDDPSDGADDGTLYQLQNVYQTDENGEIRYGSDGKPVEGSWIMNVRKFMKKDGYTEQQIDEYVSGIIGQFSIIEALGGRVIGEISRNVKGPADQRMRAKKGPLRSNSDPIYIVSFDASSMCRKRLSCAKTALLVEQRIGRPLTPDELVALVALYRAAGKDAPCLYCYVESGRKRSNAAANEGLKYAFGNEKAPSSWGKKSVGLANDARAEVRASEGLRMTDVDTSILFDPNVDMAAPTDEMMERYPVVYSEAIADRDAGRELKSAHEYAFGRFPALYQYIKTKTLEVKANMAKPYEEYDGQVLGLSDNMVEELNGYAGFRVFSSSDFQSEHVVDLIQLMHDLALKKAKSHAYTKVPDYVEIFGDTGQKICMSCFARYNEKTGEIEADTSQGWNWEEAREMRDRHPDAGTVLVASDDRILEWGLAQDWIDYIIPFHGSSMAKEHVSKMGWVNFTYWQEEHNVDASDNGKPKRVRMHEMGTQEGITNAEGTKRYLKLCFDRGITPVFPAYMFRRDLSNVSKDNRFAGLLAGMQQVTDELVESEFQKRSKSKAKNPVTREAVRAQLVKDANRRAAEAWKAIVEGGVFDWNALSEVVNPNLFKLKKDYARTDTPFNVVDPGKINMEKASFVLQDTVKDGVGQLYSSDERIADDLAGIISKGFSGEQLSNAALDAMREKSDLHAKLGLPEQPVFYKGPLEKTVVPDRTYQENGVRQASEADEDAAYFDAIGRGDMDAVRAIDRNSFGVPMSMVTVFDKAFSRAEVEESLKALSGKELYNRIENIYAKVNATQRRKLKSRKGINKSISNGFGGGIHLSMAAKIENIWRNAAKVIGGNDDLVHRFVSAIQISGKDAFVWMTVKNTDEGLRIYSIELMDEKRLGETFSTLTADNPKDATRPSLKGVVAKLNAVEGNMADDGMDVNTMLYQTAWHGTPHRFDKFSLDHIGGGEGAQTHGWGLYFNGTEDVRGMVQLHSSEAEGRDLITLFENADESTFIHEAAHVYLEMLRKVATAPGATEDIRKLWDDVREVLSGHGDIDGMHISVEAHETFAASMEAYLKEGKAPSLNLASVFRKFASWLRAIYNAFVSMAHRPSPDLAPMFDRIFASDQEMAEAEEWHEARNEWASLAEEATAGRKVRELTEQAESEARAKLVEKMARAYLRAQGGSGDLMKKAREQAKSMPVYAAAEDAIRQGGLDYDTVRALMGEEYTKRIAKKRPGILRRDGGTDPTTVAADHGYGSVYEWLSELVDAKGVQAEAQEIYKAGFEKLKATMAEGMAAEQNAVPGDEEYHSEARLAVLAAERQLLEEKARRSRSAQAMARSMRDAHAEAKAVMAAAEERLASMPVRDAVSSMRFSVQERRAARAAWKAAQEGKWAKAEACKRQEAMFHALFMASLKMSRAVDKGLAGVKAAVGLKKLSPEHRDMMLELAYRFGLLEFGHGMKPAESLAAFREMAERDGREYMSLREWEEWAANAGYPVYIPDIADAQPVHWKDLTLEQFGDLMTVFHQIRTVDRKERTVELAGRTVEIAELVAAMEAQASRTHERDVRDRWNDGTMRERMKHYKGALHSAHAKIEAVLMDLDDWEFGGVWHDAIFRPIAEAEKVQMQRMRETLGKLDELKGLIFKTNSDRVSVFSDRMFIPEIKVALTMNQILSVALNCGNAENRSRLAIGEGWTEDQIDAVLGRLEKRHWDYVQGIWDLLETFKPESFALEREMTGRSPKAVEATPVQTAFGEYRGGYYPIVYDPKLGDLAHARDQERIDQQLFGGRNYGTAMTRHGHLQDRGKVGTGEHLKLDLGVVATHLYDTIHDLAFRKAVVDVAKLLRNRSVQAVMRDWMGPEVSRLFLPWLQDIANEMQSMENQEFVHRFLSWARNGTTMVAMGWKVTTIVLQPLGILQTLAYIGPRWTGEGLKEFYLHPLEIGAKAEWVFGKSEFLRNRIVSFDREVRAATESMSKTDKVIGPVRRFAFAGIGYAQLGVDIPTWIGAYRKGLRDFVGDEQRAIEYADHVVRMSQSSGLTKDLAQIQRGTLPKVFTMFYSFFNALYQLLWRAGKISRKPGGGYDVPTLAGQALLLWILPSVLSELVAGRGPDGEDPDEEEWAAWAANKILLYPLQALVFGRDIANGVGEGFGFKMTPAESTPASLVWLTRTWAKIAAGDKDMDSDVVIKSFEQSGYILRLPTRQAGITLGNIYDYATGKTPDFQLRDLVFPKQKDRR